MNYDQALEISEDGKPTGKFHYTRTRDNQTWPIGYCAETPRHSHNSKKEAEECYKKYELDTNLVLEAGTLENTQAKCQIEGCPGWTIITSRVGTYTVFILCDKHRNRETIEKIYSVNYSIHS